MKFTTFVINRRKIRIVLLCFLLASVGVAGFFAFSHHQKAVNTFAEEDAYQKIIEEQLPDYQEHPVEETDLLQKILGFNPSKPESILNEYSCIFTEQPQNEPVAVAADNTPQPSEEAEPAKSAEPAEPTAAPEEGSQHPIKEVTVDQKVELTNATQYAVDINELAKQDLEFKIEGQEPQVLVVHTHTTEAYTDSGKTTYSSSDSDRSTDVNKNIVAVGNEVCRVLEENGISTVHDTTVHDYPSYNGAYSRALTTIKSNIQKYPSIKIVLDVHRDGIVRADGTKLKVAADINGEKTAQVMFVVGSNASGLAHRDWKENLKFAAKIQQQAEAMYPGLMRPINLREERFNQHMTLGSLIIEVGSNGNTLEESVAGAKDVATALASVIKS